MSEVMELPHPYLLFLGDTTEPGYAKTAFGLRDWAADRCVGEWSCGGATVTTGLVRLSPKEARARGAKALVIGVANTGGVIGENWLPSLIEALESGLDIISGMHAKLRDVPQLKSAAERHGRRLIDVRTPPSKIPIASGASGRQTPADRRHRLCDRKKYSAGADTRVVTKRALCRFSRHGQTGILIRRRHSHGCVSRLQAGRRIAQSGCRS